MSRIHTDCPRLMYEMDFRLVMRPMMTFQTCQDDQGSCDDESYEILTY